jgi:hypothetical protein
MLIRPNDVKQMDDWSEEQFSAWLKVGLTDQISGARSPAAFAPLHRLFIPTEPILDQIAEAYGFLSTRTQERFVIGIGIAASDLPNTAIGVRTIQELTHLCGLIGSAHAIGRLIDRTSDPEFFRTVDPEDAQETFALLLNVAAGLSPGSAAKSAVMRLVTSPRFQPDYAPMAFDALVRAEPTRIADHLAIFDRILLPKETPEQTIHNLSASILAHVDTESLKRQLPLLTERFPRLANDILSEHELDLTHPNPETEQVSLRISRREKAPVWTELTDMLFESFSFARMIRFRIAHMVLQNQWGLPRGRRSKVADVVSEIPEEIDQLKQVVLARQKEEMRIDC